MNRIACVLILVGLPLCAAEGAATPRHNQGGQVGPNGVLQKVDIKIFKNKTGADTAFLQIDLGEHKYDGAKPDVLINQRPLIVLKIGTTIVFQGQADRKAKIQSDNFSAKLVNKGKGLQFTLKKENLSALLAELSGKGEHIEMLITVSDNHLPAPATRKEREAIERAGPRHAESLYENMFELDVDETAKVLIARG